MARLKLYRALIGISDNFNPKEVTREQFTSKVENARQFVGFCHKTLFCPKPGFTNRVVTVGEADDLYIKSGREVMVRTKMPADGGMVSGDGYAIAFFNADCPIIALVEGNKLTVLHAGFRTLIRQNRNELNIIEVAIKYFNPAHTKAFIGFGIGPCCWKPEYDDKPEILDPSRARARHAKILADSISKTTEASPLGAGYVSVDLYKLSKGLLIETGIAEKNILVDSRCTCCLEENGQLLFWSHNRFNAGRQEVDGRNMAIAFLTSRLHHDDGFGE